MLYIDRSNLLICRLFNQRSEMSAFIGCCGTGVTEEAIANALEVLIFSIKKGYLESQYVVD